MKHSPLSLVLALLSLSLWGLVMISPVSAQEKAKEPPATGPMPFHQLHVGDLSLVCTACHETGKTPKPGQELSFLVRPGHSACVDCHEDDFTKEKVKKENTATALCTTCHSGKGDAIGPFPSGKLTLAKFSHAAHVDPHPQLIKRIGMRQDCVFCHKVKPPEVGPGRPSHPECSACHSGSSAAKPVLAKEDEVERCLVCHSLKRIDRNMMKTSGANAHAGAAPSSQAKSHPGLNPNPRVDGMVAAQHLYRDIRPLNHRSHFKRRNGSPIGCIACHRSVLQRHAMETASGLPRMRECASCHDNATFVQAKNLIKNCQVCHRVIQADLRPRSSDPISPAIVHTEAFRVHHEVQARDSENQCGVCHTRFVDVGQNNCAGCHSSMQPRSHRALRFREMPHGRLAGFDRKACVNCHTGDFCVSCHNRVLPRSHVPLQTFAGRVVSGGPRIAGAHREQAILNLRSCFVCHTFANNCTRCHTRQLP